MTNALEIIKVNFFTECSVMFTARLPPRNVTSSAHASIKREIYGDLAINTRKLNIMADLMRRAGL